MRDRHRDKFFAPWPRPKTLLYTRHVGDSPRYSAPSLFIGRQWSRGRIEDADFVAKSLFTPCARRPSISRRIHLGLEFEPLPLEIPEKALNQPPSCKLSSFPGRWLPGRTFYCGKEPVRSQFEYEFSSDEEEFVKTYFKKSSNWFLLWKREWKKQWFQLCYQITFSSLRDIPYFDWN